MTTAYWGAVRRLALDHVAGEPSSNLEQRAEAVAQRCGADRGSAIEDLRGLAKRLPQRFVVGVPPRVFDGRGLPHTELDVHALVQPELGMGSAEPRLLHASPRALAGAVAEHVVVDPDHARLDLAGDPLPLAPVGSPHGGAEAEV